MTDQTLIPRGDEVIPRALLGRIVDEVFGGACKDTSPIEKIYRMIVRDQGRQGQLAGLKGQGPAAASGETLDPALAPYVDLLTYVLQDDVHNRLTPRVIDIAYTAFTVAKDPNKEDGGPSDWFNDTRPVVQKAIDRLRRDLFADRAKAAGRTAGQVDESPRVDEIMAQAQVFASAWSLAGGRFDTGNDADNAEEQKRGLREMVAQALAYRASSVQALVASAKAAVVACRRVNRVVDGVDFASLGVGLTRSIEGLESATTETGPAPATNEKRRDAIVQWLRRRESWEAVTLTGGLIAEIAQELSCEVPPNGQERDEGSALKRPVSSPEADLKARQGRLKIVLERLVKSLQHARDSAKDDFSRDGSMFNEGRRIAYDQAASEVQSALGGESR